MVKRALREGARCGLKTRGTTAGQDMTEDERLDRAKALLEQAGTDKFLAWRLSYGTFVSDDWQYLYFETPKCACTSTKMHLWDLDNRPRGRDWLDVVHDRKNSDPRPSLVTISHDEAVHFLTSPDVTRFYVSRDPVRRLVSGYLDKIKTHPGYDRIRNAMVEKYKLSSRQEISFRHFAEFVCWLSEDDRDAHWRSQSSLLLTEYIDFNFSISMENYAAGMAELFKRLSVPPHLVPDFGERVNSTHSEREKVDPDVRRLIEGVFAEDFRLGPRHS